MSQIAEIEKTIPTDIGAHFTEVFIENADNVALVLSLLEVGVLSGKK